MSKKCENKVNIRDVEKLEVYHIKLDDRLQYIEIKNPYIIKWCCLLVDSGAQINVIKTGQISPVVQLQVKKLLVAKITSKQIKTLEIAKIPINN